MARPRKSVTTAHGPEHANGNGHGSLVDLADLFANETAVVSIYDPRDEYLKPEDRRDTGFRVEIAPLWSPEAREVAQKNRDRIRLVDGEVDADDQGFKDSLLEQLIVVTKRWWHIDAPDQPITLHGEALECTPENKRAVYTNPRLESTFFAQVRSGYLDRSRFFGQPQKTA